MVGRGRLDSTRGGSGFWDVRLPARAYQLVALHPTVPPLTRPSLTASNPLCVLRAPRDGSGRLCGSSVTSTFLGKEKTKQSHRVTCTMLTSPWIGCPWIRWPSLVQSDEAGAWPKPGAFRKLQAGRRCGLYQQLPINAPEGRVRKGI